MRAGAAPMAHAPSLITRALPGSLPSPHSLRVPSTASSVAQMCSRAARGSPCALPRGARLTNVPASTSTTTRSCTRQQHGVPGCCCRWHARGAATQQHGAPGCCCGWRARACAARGPRAQQAHLVPVRVRARLQHFKGSSLAHCIRGGSGLVGAGLQKGGAALQPGTHVERVHGCACRHRGGHGCVSQAQAHGLHGWQGWLCVQARPPAAGGGGGARVRAHCGLLQQRARHADPPACTPA